VIGPKFFMSRSALFGFSIRTVHPYLSLGVRVRGTNSVQQRYGNQLRREAPLEDSIRPVPARILPLKYRSKLLDGERRIIRHNDWVACLPQPRWSRVLLSIFIVSKFVEW